MYNAQHSIIFWYQCDNKIVTNQDIDVEFGYRFMHSYKNSFTIVIKRMT